MTFRPLREHHGYLEAITVALLIVSIGLLIGFLTFWLVNLDTVAPALGIGRFLDRFVPEPVLSFLRRASLDRSTISPLIGCLISIAMARASLALLLSREWVGRLVRRGAGRFPFGSTYQTTYVQLGLIGTLFSFLLLADDVKVGAATRAIETLSQSLETALVSTLSGIVAAYFVGPALVYLYDSIRETGELPDASEAQTVSELKEALEKLRNEVNDLSRAFSNDNKSGLKKDADDAGSALQDLASRLKNPNIEDPLRVAFETVSDRLHSDLEQRDIAVRNTLSEGLRDFSSAAGDGLRKIAVSLEQAHGKLSDSLAAKLEEAMRHREDTLCEQQNRLLKAMIELVRELQAGRDGIHKTINSAQGEIKVKREKALEQVEKAKAAAIGDLHKELDDHKKELERCISKWTGRPRRPWYTAWLPRRWFRSSR